MALWYDSLGNPIDVTDIDKEYALNIYTMYTTRKARAGWTADDFRVDELAQTLRETILHGREKSAADIERARRYNAGNLERGYPFRAPER